MFERSRWLRIWIGFTAIWTLVVATVGWFNLPRAQHIAHNPEFLARLSNEVPPIPVGNDAKAKLDGLGAPVWSDAQIVVRMPNGSRLTLPATTTYKRVALIKDEYYRMLEAEARAQTAPYLLEMAVAWLLPFPILYVLGLAMGFICRVYRPASRKADPEAAVAGPIIRHAAARSVRDPFLRPQEPFPAPWAISKSASAFSHPRNTSHA